MHAVRSTHAQVLRACACALGAFALVLFAPRAEAAEQSPTLQYSPTIISIQADAGEQVTRTVTVTALNGPLELDFVHADFGFVGDDYAVKLIPDDAPETTAFSTRGWFELDPRRFTVPANKQRKVRLTIDVPDNTPAGTYLGAALLRLAPSAAAGETQVRTFVQGGPLVFVSVAGGKPPKARIKSFELPRFATEGPVVPEITLENVGDEYFSVEGTVALRGPGPDSELTIGRQFVIPGKPRALKASSDAKGADGSLRLGTDDLRFGRYTVESRLRVEPTGKTIVSTRSFWVVPTWMRVIGVILLLGIAALGFQLYRRHRVRRLIEAFPDEDEDSDPRAEADQDPAADSEEPRTD